MPAVCCQFTLCGEAHRVRTMTFAIESEETATAVVSHQVQEGHEEPYEAWLHEIGTAAKAYAGYLGVQVIRPVPGASVKYTAIVRFDSRTHLLAWLASEDRKHLVEKVRPHLAADDSFFVKTGLDFWFTPEGARALVPTAWKQFLVTWSAIFPLVLLVPPLWLALLASLGISQNHYLVTFLATGTVCLLMVYVVMPRYTRLIKGWLFK